MHEFLKKKHKEEMENIKDLNLNDPFFVNNQPISSSKNSSFK